MISRSAVIFVPDDTAKTGYPTPVLLLRCMGVPLLAWLVNSMVSSGVGRFFLVCGSAHEAQARACFPEGVEVMCVGSDAPAEQLHVFLSTADDAEEEITVVTAPCVYIPSEAVLCEDVARDDAPIPAGVAAVHRAALMDALDEAFSFQSFLQEHARVLTDRDGYFSVTQASELADWAPILRRLHLNALAESGVEIWDFDNCYVDPTVIVGRGTQLLPGTILRGRTVVGCDCVIGPNSDLEDCVVGDRARVEFSRAERASVGTEACVGPFAHLRPDSQIGGRVKIGNFVEIKNAAVDEETWISHLSYVGDSEIGKRCNLGCGTVTVNFDRKDKHRTVIGDDAFVGCNSSLIAPLRVGKGAYIGAGSVITEDVPAQALALARARQSIRKDWAEKHKK